MTQKAKVDLTAILNALKYSAMNFVFNENNETVTRPEIIAHLQKSIDQKLTINPVWLNPVNPVRLNPPHHFCVKNTRMEGTLIADLGDNYVAVHWPTSKYHGDNDYHVLMITEINIDATEEGYRLLKPGEPFQSDDQIWTDKGWQGTNRIGQYIPDDGALYRRKETS